MRKFEEIVARGKMVKAGISLNRNALLAVLRIGVGQIRFVVCYHPGERECRGILVGIP